MRRVAQLVLVAAVAIIAVLGTSAVLFYQEATGHKDPQNIPSKEEYIDITVPDDPSDDLSSAVVFDNGGYWIKGMSDGQTVSSSDLAVLVGKASADASVTLTLQYSDYLFRFDNAALRSLSAEDSVLSVERLSSIDGRSDLVGDIYDISFGGNSDLGEGTLSVTVPYTGVPAHLKVYRIVGDGLEELTASADGSRAVFTTSHLSVFALIQTEHSLGDPVIENTIAATTRNNSSYDSVTYCTVCGTEVSRTSCEGNDQLPSAEVVFVSGGYRASNVKSGDYISYADISTMLQTAASGSTSFTVVLDGAVVVFDNTAIRALKSEDAMLRVVKVQLPEEYSSFKSGDVYEVSFGNNVDFGSGTVSVTVPYSGSSAHIEAYILEGGTAAKVPSVSDGSFVTFRTSHLAMFILVHTDHTSGEPVTENVVTATTQNNSSYDTVTYCTVCGEEVAREHHEGDDMLPSAIVSHRGGEYTASMKSGDYLSYADIAMMAHAAVSNDRVSLAVEYGDCVLFFDAVAIKALKVEDTLISIVKIDLPSEYTARVSPIAVYSLSVGDFTTLGEGEVTVKVPYTGASAHLGVHLLEGGQVSGVSSATEGGYAVFQAVHFSIFALTQTEHSAGPVIKENEVVATTEHGSSYDEVVYCSVCGGEMSRDHVENNDRLVEPEVAYAEVVSEGSSYFIRNLRDGDHVRAADISAMAASASSDAATTFTVVYGTYKLVFDSAALTCLTAEDSSLHVEKVALSGEYSSYDTYAISFGNMSGIASGTLSVTMPYSGISAHLAVIDTVTSSAVPSSVDGGQATFRIQSFSIFAMTQTDHSAGDAVTENAVSATTRNDSSYDTVVYCGICGAEMSRIHHTGEDRLPSMTFTASGINYLAEAAEGQYLSYADIATMVRSANSGNDAVLTLVYGDCTLCFDSAALRSFEVRDTPLVLSKVPVPTEYADIVGIGEVYSISFGDGSFGGGKVSVTVPYDGVPAHLRAFLLKGGSASEIVSSANGSTAILTSTELGLFAMTQTDHSAGDVVTENAVSATTRNDSSYDEVVYCTVCGKEISRVHHTGEDKLPSAPVSYSGGVYTAIVGNGEYISYADISTVKQAAVSGNVRLVLLYGECSIEIDRTVLRGLEVRDTLFSIDPIEVPSGYSFPTSAKAFSFVFGNTLNGAVTVKVPYSGMTAHLEMYLLDEGNAVPIVSSAENGLAMCQIISPSMLVVIESGHTAGPSVRENEVSATKDHNSSYDVVTYCTVCGKELSRDHVENDDRVGAVAERLNNYLRDNEFVRLSQSVVLDGDLVIPAGHTLLIPYSSDDNSGFASGDGSALTSLASSEYIYSKLTNSHTITVYGTLLVGSIIGKNETFSYQGHTSSYHGSVENNGSIVVKSGGKLECYGTITGSGTVTAEPGSVLQEPLVITDFVGADNMYSQYKNGQSVFNRYGFVNIQCTAVIENGATFYGFFFVYVATDGSFHDYLLEYISDGNSFIDLSDGATATFTYDPDRAVESTESINLHSDVGTTAIRISGGASFGAPKATITYSGEKMTFDFSTFIFSIPYNFKISLANGSYVMNNQYRILPGASVTVEKGATLELKGTLEAYWGLTSKVFKNTCYPSTSVLKACGIEPAGRLIVNGTLVLDAGSTMLGIAESETAGAVIRADADSHVSLSRVDFGYSGKCSIKLYGIPVKSWSVDNHTYCLLRGYIIGPDGALSQIIAGTTYVSGEPTTYLKDTYSQLPDELSGPFELNYAFRGSWSAR